MFLQFFLWTNFRGGFRGGGRTRRAPPLKLEKIWFFGVKSWFFTRNTPKIFAPPSAIGNNMIFWRKIVIFHTKYPKNFRASLRSAQFFLSAPPPNLKSWIRPWICGSAYWQYLWAELIIKNPRWYEQHYYETVCHMTQCHIPQKFEFSKWFLLDWCRIVF